MLKKYEYECSAEKYCLIHSPVKSGKRMGQICDNTLLKSWQYCYIILIICILGLIHFMSTALRLKLKNVYINACRGSICFLA